MIDRTKALTYILLLFENPFPLDICENMEEIIFHYFSFITALFSLLLLLLYAHTTVHLSFFSVESSVSSCRFEMVWPSLMPISLPVINLEEANPEKPVVWAYWLGNIQVTK